MIDLAQLVYLLIYCALPVISEIIANKFPYAPTSGQSYAFKLFDQLLEKNSKTRDCILIKGYAGTGKTTLISALTEVLPLFNLKYLQMAPTGRAAKVMSSYSQKPAYTIHKIIYKRKVDAESGEVAFSKSKNYNKDTVFIIDEASMISDNSGINSQNLIRDLVDYIYQNPGNKMLIIGDAAQLPPVGSSNSPALDSDFMAFQFNLSIKSIELTEVVRQEQLSGILENATRLRDLIKNDLQDILFDTKPFKDIYRINAVKLEDGIRYAYNKYGVENSTIICRSNWQAVQYNQLVRRNILFYDEELEAGDIIMVVKNNYFYLEPDSDAGFIANGDFLEIKKIVDFEEKYGFRFATLSVKLVDYPAIPSFDVKVILDTLYSNAPALSQEENKRLYNETSADVMKAHGKKNYRAALQGHEYLNALQIKFAYALTCHKSQGGQWDIVFLDQGIRGDAEIDSDYTKWLYTAVTRASNELYLVNFEDRFFKK